MFTKIECGECGDEYIVQGERFICYGCDHIITAGDVALDEGESLAVRGGVLGYYYAPEGVL